MSKDKSLILLIYRLSQRCPVEPKSKELLAFGIKSDVKSACTVTVSTGVSPIIKLPPSVMSPVTSRLPMMSMFVNATTLPVPAASSSKLLLLDVVVNVLPLNARLPPATPFSSNTIVDPSPLVIVTLV